MRFRDYTRRANPPCHTSSSGLSFQYGDDPGHPGAVVIGCWNPGCQGPGWVDRIEDALGAAIQVWRTKENGCGDYRYRLWSGGGVSAPAPGPRARKPVPPLAWVPLPATPQEVDGFTLADLWASPVFFVGGGKTKHAVTWKDEGGETSGYRHSQQAADGGVRVARFGGIAKGVRIHPWMSYEDIQGVIHHSDSRAWEGRHPCLSLSGDAATPWPLDVGVIDADYKPDKDPEGWGRGVPGQGAGMAHRAGLPRLRFHVWQRFPRRFPAGLIPEPDAGPTVLWQKGPGLSFGGALPRGAAGDLRAGGQAVGGHQEGPCPGELRRSPTTPCVHLGNPAYGAGRSTDRGGERAASVREAADRIVELALMASSRGVRPPPPPLEILNVPIPAPRSLAGKLLAGFYATPSRRIPVLYGMVVHIIRCSTHYFIDYRR